MVVTLSWTLLGTSKWFESRAIEDAIRTTQRRIETMIQGLFESRGKIRLIGQAPLGVCLLASSYTEKAIKYGKCHQNEISFYHFNFLLSSEPWKASSCRTKFGYLAVEGERKKTKIKSESDQNSRSRERKHIYQFLQFRQTSSPRAASSGSPCLSHEPYVSAA